jgi:hypothetical protein
MVRCDLAVNMAREERRVMLKPMTLMDQVIPTKDEEERAALRPIGRNRERHQAAVRGRPTRWAFGELRRSSITSGRRATHLGRLRGDERHKAQIFEAVDRQMREAVVDRIAGQRSPA